MVSTANSVEPQSSQYLVFVTSLLQSCMRFFLWLVASSMVSTAGSVEHIYTYIYIYIYTYI